MLIKKTRTAEIYIIDNTIIKFFISTLDKNERHRLGPKHCVCGEPVEVLLKNEITILKKLEKYNNFPKIISINQEEYSYTMTYCGKNLADLKKKKKLKIPKNYKEQIDNISNALTEINIYNNDIALSNICINNDIIYLIDFGCCQPLDIKIKENFDGRNNLIDLNNLFSKLI